MKNKFLVKINAPIVFILLSFIIQSCEPAYSVHIRNEREDTIEVLLSGDSTFNQPPMSFLRMQNDNYVYEMEATSEVTLYLIVNQDLTTERFPFDTILIVTNSDTTELNGKDVIFENFIAENDFYNYLLVQ